MLRHPLPNPPPQAGEGAYFRRGHNGVRCIEARHPRRAGDSSASLLHCRGEAATRVRSHISPGPYRSFRELSLAGPVGSVTWCPPTFVGNSGIECSNGQRGFALFFFCRRVIAAGPSRSFAVLSGRPGILVHPLSRAMTAKYNAACPIAPRVHRRPICARQRLRGAMR